MFCKCVGKLLFLFVMENEAHSDFRHVAKGVDISLLALVDLEPDASKGFRAQHVINTKVMRRCIVYNR